jgi:diacylglycerol kinase family enzyme
MAAYCAKATYLWFVHPKPYFEIEFCDGAQERKTEISQLLAVRIRDFGGVLRKLAPGASLDRADMRLVLFRTRSRIRYLRYIIRGLLRADWQVPGIELAYSTEAKCSVLRENSSKPSRILIEADGELLGMLPARVSMVHDAVNLLIPKS